MNSYTQLARTGLRNFAYVLAGSAFYRMSALLLLPLYARWLSPDQFGRLEQLLAVSLLAAAVLSLQVQESLLSYFQHDPAEAASTSAIMLLGSACIAALAGTLAWVIVGDNGAVIAALVAHVVTAFGWQYVRNLLRVSGRFDRTMASEVVLAGAAIPASALMIIVLEAGVAGALFGVAIGNACGMLFGMVRTPGLAAVLAIASVGRAAASGILAVSLRLVPNVILWWVIELSDRLLIAWFLGDAEVAAYGAGARLAGIVMAATLLLYQAWQIPAIAAIQQGAGARFLAATFVPFASILLLGASLLLSAAQPMANLLLGAAYVGSVQYTAVLVPALCLSGFCYFFGIWYYRSAAKASPLVAGVAGLSVSLVLNLILIPVLGALGAAFSSLCAYLVMCAMRYREAARVLGLSVAWRRIAIPCMIVACQAAGLYMGIDYGILAIGTALLLLTALPQLRPALELLRGAGQPTDEPAVPRANPGGAEVAGRQG